MLDVAAGHRERPLTVRAVRAVADLSLDELRQREEAYGTMLESDLISSAGVDAAHTLNHPGNSVLIGVARRVQASLGLSPTAAEPGRVLLGELFAAPHRRRSQYPRPRRGTTTKLDGAG